ncbi:BA14K family protein [Aureimonas populi]|uniref:Lectin-like protein BA14k n=1 Tax=Aureimonas populi TaxID=1701758 RepID=A0ABW5CHJ7_9HYPH|nr:BA14K family protein [Aureimonas populi]
MRKLFSSMMAVAMLATGSVTMAPTEASAQSIREQQRFVERYCARNPGNRDCRDFRRGGGRNWDQRRYQRWYRDNYRHDRRDGNQAAIAAIFGLAAGAIAGGAIAGGDNRRPGARNVSRESVARCAQRYRTYDPATHTYVANSRGERRVCQL